MPHHRLLIPALFLLGLCSQAQAWEYGRPVTGDLLVTVGEWSKMCKTSAYPINSCLLQLIRPLARAGRGSDDFIVPPLPASHILTRSGVLLAPPVNKQINEVLTDNGNLTSVVLKSGEHCKTFAAHGGHLVSHSDPRAYASLMRFITDDPAASIQTLEPVSVAGKQAYRFSQPANRLLGTYIVDKRRNAGIWAVCQSELAEPGPQARAFLAGIVGSARQY